MCYANSGAEGWAWETSLGPEARTVCDNGERTQRDWRQESIEREQKLKLVVDVGTERWLTGSLGCSLLMCIQRPRSISRSHTSVAA